MSQRIAVYSRATTPLGFELAAFVAALNEYVASDLCPAWGVSASLSVAPGPISGAWGMVFLDHADVEGALAYHTDDGLPLAKVFVKTTLDAGASLSVSASHELAEMLADPAANLYALAGDQETLYAYEIADAVEDDSLGFEVAGFMMSSFVLPAWFDPTAKGARFDRSGILTAPFQLHSGGYAITMKDGAVGQIFGSGAKARAFAREDRRGHRSELRQARAATWGKP